jgi:hypothetical protein
MQSQVDSKAVRIRLSPVLAETGDHSLAVGPTAVATALVAVEFSVFSIEFEPKFVGFNWNPVQLIPRQVVIWLVLSRASCICTKTGQLLPAPASGPFLTDLS